MSRVCQITGKKVISGNNVSHSHIKTRRKFHPNLQVKKFYNPETGNKVEFSVSYTGGKLYINKSESAIIASTITSEEPVEKAANKSKIVKNHP